MHPASLMRVSEKYDPYNNSNEMKETIIKITVKQFEFSCTRTIYGIPYEVIPGHIPNYENGTTLDV